MSFSSGFGSGDRGLQVLQQAGDLNALGEPKGLIVQANRVLDLVLFNVRERSDPNDRGRAFSYEEAKAYILARPDLA